MLSITEVPLFRSFAPILYHRTLDIRVAISIFAVADKGDLTMDNVD